MLQKHYIESNRENIKVSNIKCEYTTLHNNMFTQGCLEGTSIWNFSTHPFIGCDHRQDGLVKWVRFSNVVNTETLEESRYNFRVYF